MFINSSQRYDRQVRLPEFGPEAQARLRHSRVAIVGVGGLGCPAALYLAAAGIGFLRLIDDDRVELTNLHRQVLFQESDCGKLKAEQARHHLRAINSEVEIDVVSERFEEHNALECVRDCDIVIDGSDNFETRYLVNDACVVLDKTLVFASVDGFEAQLSVLNHPVSSDNRSASLRCIFPSSPAAHARRDCEVHGILGVVPGIVGTMMAAQTIAALTGTSDVLANTLLHIDLRSMQMTKYAVSRNEAQWQDCPRKESEFHERTLRRAAAAPATQHLINVQQLQELLQSDEILYIADFRDDSAEEAGIDTLHQHALTDFASVLQQLDADITVVLLCERGIRSTAVLKDIEGFASSRKLYALRGGLREWRTFRNQQDAI